MEMQRLENEVGWQAAESEKVSQMISTSHNDLVKSQEELLTTLGCQCTSAKINLTTVDQDILKRRESSQLGQYLFQVRSSLKSISLLNYIYRECTMKNHILPRKMGARCFYTLTQARSSGGSPLNLEVRRTCSLLQLRVPQPSVLQTC